MKEIFFVLVVLPGILALPEQGAFEVNMSDTQNIAVFTKSMYSNTSISVKILCNQETAVPVTITWLLRWTPCAQEYANIDTEKNLAQMYLETPQMLRPDMPYQMVRYFKHTEDSPRQCSANNYISLSEPVMVPTVLNGTSPVVKKSTDEEKDDKSKGKTRNKRADPATKPTTSPKPAAAAATSTFLPLTSSVAPFNPVSSSSAKTTAASSQSPDAGDSSSTQTTTSNKTAQGSSTTQSSSTEASSSSTGSSSSSTGSSSSSTSSSSTEPTSPGASPSKADRTHKEHVVTHSDPIDAALANKGRKQSKNKNTFSKLFDMIDLDKESTDEFHRITHTWEDGIYLFILRVEASQHFNATVDVRMKGPRGGFLSAIEWPLLPFYGVMCFVYVIFGLIWLVLSFCNWRDLLRIQFWIGGVIFLGMLEKAVFFAEYESINATGKSVRGAILFGELVSCLKRTLARMLVIIVSLGFGIVKPRLGPVLHKVLALGGLYFVLCAVEGCLRDLKAKSDNSNQATLAAIPLAVLDAAICWWIFTGLVNTIRTLRLRRNLVKLSLYRHFTNTLIFAVVASVAFMVWSITQHKFSKCLSDWKELWVDEAFWHLLFSVILMVIMLLWRPSANNQRYAFSPLMDAADDEAGEPMINDAFDGMKMRGVKGQSNGSPGQKDQSKADEDLKWIDENIPSSVADTALPSLLDSDEEMMNTKYEMSKME